jgi:hypothetical protein
MERHLRGTDANGAPFVMGVYPMFADNICSFLAADFDEGEWQRDVFAFRDSCERHGIAVAIERSRASLGISVTIEDCRLSGAAVPLAFTGALRPDQETAITALLPHDTGVLAATTAFGKTILAIRMMAERGRKYIGPCSSPTAHGSMD